MDKLKIVTKVWLIFPILAMIMTDCEQRIGVTSPPVRSTSAITLTASLNNGRGQGDSILTEKEPLRDTAAKQPNFIMIHSLKNPVEEFVTDLVPIPEKIGGFTFNPILKTQFMFNFH